MANFRKVLLKEQQRLEKIKKKAEEQLKNAPPGTLHISYSGKYVQYYHNIAGERRTYIPRKNEKLPFQLAQKAYDEKVLKLVKKRLTQIREILSDYEDTEIEKIYLSEIPERQRLIQPIEVTREERERSWMSKMYEQKEFAENAPFIWTEKGERVRSKSEKILADYFYHKKILYQYERPLYLKGFGTVHPDFTFLSRETGEEIYWEHDGRMDDPIYAQNAVKKIQAYEENGIYPGERLILTFETSKVVLNTQLIDGLVHKYLL